MGPTGAFESLGRITIRELRRDDHDGWMELWTGYLRFYRVQIGEQVTSMTFTRLCETKDGMFGLVAVEADGEVLGFANSLVHPSTWSIAGYCYLEDLFVAPHARGGEVAKGLIDGVAAVARERGVERMYWHTQQFNGAARSLYDTVGKLTSMVVYEREV
ncbi:MAG: GNAT family N-acetyltransferase [Solirubrobacteraceae bacterium]|jgi:GNAT superfamily N-acetyltransferase